MTIDPSVHPTSEPKKPSLLSHVEEINVGMKEGEVQHQAEKTGLTYVNLKTTPINPDVFHLVDKQVLIDAQAVPFVHQGSMIGVATLDPKTKGFERLIEAFKTQGFQVKPSLTSEESLTFGLRLITEQVEEKKTELEAHEETVGSYDDEAHKISELARRLADLSEEQLVDELILGAVRTHTSDIHIQPSINNVIVRFRVDGLLHDMFSLPKETYDKLITALKFKADMKLNIGYKPQDGKFGFQVSGRLVSVRMSTLPTEYGESVVLRLLDSQKKSVGLPELGFSAHNLGLLQEALKKTEGMLLVTGPTGSGKTTTLYAVLEELNQPEKKIITLEDPIEYHLEHIAQSQIRESEGYTFALGLRAILRQDPNIVMVGEIRDQETADIAVQAALTGHVMLSTVHTNNALETIPRLLNMGVERYLLAPALTTIVAQRLIRKVCPHCSVTRPLSTEERTYIEKAQAFVREHALGIDLSMPEHLSLGKGCDACSHTGYLGQVAISEVLPLTKNLKDLITAQKSTNELYKQALQDGYIPLKLDGLQKVLEGKSTLEEVYRVSE